MQSQKSELKNKAELMREIIYLRNFLNPKTDKVMLQGIIDYFLVISSDSNLREVFSSKFGYVIFLTFIPN